MLFWTEKHTETLRALTIQGASARDIAKVLGCTRNAVLGKQNRLRVKRRAQPKLKTKPKAKRAPLAVEVHFKTQPLPPEDNGPGKVLLREAGDGQCRWGYGAPSPEFTICGEAAKGSWCPAHRARVFTPRTKDRNAPTP